MGSEDLSFVLVRDALPYGGRGIACPGLIESLILADMPPTTIVIKWNDDTLKHLPEKFYETRQWGQFKLKLNS